MNNRAQDEEGPSRAECNHALMQLVEADDFAHALSVLNHRAEVALIDAMHLYSARSWRAEFGVENTFQLIKNVKWKTDGVDAAAAIDHMRAAITEHLHDLR